jgi:hypothetical protein
LIGIDHLTWIFTKDFGYSSPKMRMDPGIRVVNDEDVASHYLQSKVIALMLVIAAGTAVYTEGKSAEVGGGSLDIKCPLTKVDPKDF